jgi:stage V sporulation protein D (sporulation-specific penicillin-binding protein)
MFEDIKDLIAYGEMNDIKGIFAREAYVRAYPNDNFAASVIGFTQNNTGAYGIELFYNKYLVGEDGKSISQIVEESTGSLEIMEPIDGSDIYTTIDFTIQSYVEQAINKFVSEVSAESVRVIIMDPRDGSILAMSSYPDFNPNLPYNEISRNDTYNVTSQQELWKNSNISNGYEPGSTFKPFTVAMALEENLIDIDNDKFYCPGYKIPYPGVDPIYCWKRDGHGIQTVFEALANSCNVALMDIGVMVGRENFAKYQQTFGFGKVTGVDLPGDVSMRSAMYSVDELDPVQLQTSSFGQGQAVTHLQLITGFSSLINGGLLYQPRILDRIIDQNGNIVVQGETIVLNKVASREVSDSMRKALESVVSEGTGKSAELSGYSIGGKTGTSEIGDRSIKDYIVSFVGFSPVENPEVITLVVVDKPQAEKVDSRIATKLFKEIMKDVLPYLSIEKKQES